MRVARPGTMKMEPNKDEAQRRYGDASAIVSAVDRSLI
jgi:hypothetical protein